MTKYESPTPPIQVRVTALMSGLISARIQATILSHIQSHLRQDKVFTSLQTKVIGVLVTSAVPLEHPQSRSPEAAGTCWWGERCSSPTGKWNRSQSQPQSGQTAGLRTSLLLGQWNWEAAPEHMNRKHKIFWTSTEEASFSFMDFCFYPFSFVTTFGLDCLYSILIS